MNLKTFYADETEIFIVLTLVAEEMRYNPKLWTV
jgi:hypothetical protein